MIHVRRAQVLEMLIVRKDLSEQQAEHTLKAGHAWHVSEGRQVSHHAEGRASSRVSRGNWLANQSNPTTARQIGHECQGQP